MEHYRHEVDEEDIGIRAMHVRRAKAVERAMQLLRHGLGNTFRELTPEAVSDLEYAFGEVWSFVAHSEWDELRFSALTFSDIEKIRALAEELRQGSRNETMVLGEIEAFLREKPE